MKVAKRITRIEPIERADILQKISDYEQMFFDSKGMIFSSVGFIFTKGLPQEIRQHYDKHCSDYTFFEILLIPKISCDEDKKEWGDIWKSFIEDETFMTGFYVSEVLLVSKGNLPVLFVHACDKDGWAYSHYTPFTRAHEKATPVRIGESVVYMDTDAQVLND